MVFSTYSTCFNVFSLTLKGIACLLDHPHMWQNHGDSHRASRFENWKASPYHDVHNVELAAAILDVNLRDEILKKGMAIKTGKDLHTPEEPTVRYWKIAPGRNASEWDEWKAQNLVSISWEGVGDLTGKTKGELHQLYEQTMENNPDLEWGQGGEDQLWSFLNIKIGDRIIANKGIDEILGYGTVIDNYEFIPGIEYGHRISVQWDNLENRAINEPGWRKTIIELTKEKFEELIASKHTEGFFSDETFKLLSGLSQNPTAAFYKENAEAIKENIERPFQSLLLATVEKLDQKILERMEVENNLFSRILKNDYGRGGAWDFYWGAFYPKENKRQTGPQLFMVLNHEILLCGFMFGSGAVEAKKRFSTNCLLYKENIVELLGDFLQEEGFSLGNRYLHQFEKLKSGREIPNTIEEWLDDPYKTDQDLAVVIPREELIKMGSDELVHQIAQIFNRVFPFVILATSTNPISEIEKYMNIVRPAIIHSEYPLEQISEESGFEIAELKRWLRSIERKKQVVFYGPPGTGKTFIAEKIAKHLIGGGTGFYELIQFHPEVSYEDFIQGIRPQENLNGGLSYPLVPGRFLEVCEKARQTESICVLIIDEINRANLSRVFGELMYLLEYREKSIKLAAGTEFMIPENLRIIGTMNTADRSIALVDHALRRRFAFISLYPNYDVLRKYHKGEKTGFNPENLIRVLEKLNQQIGDRHYEIGCSYFLRKDIVAQIKDIWQMEIEPYLEEYFFDQPSSYEKFTWQVIGPEVAQ